MPLHDWTDDGCWESFHLLWLVQLLDWVQPAMPSGFVAYVGSVPALTMDRPKAEPVLSPIGGRLFSPFEPPPTIREQIRPKPDKEAVASFTVDPQQAIHIDRDGHLMAVIEIVSPRHKYQPSACRRYLHRYIGFLHQGIHLLLIDVLPQPKKFSFPDALAMNLGLSQEPCPTPCAVSYRAASPPPEGAWRRLLKVGQPLPEILLSLDRHRGIVVDLDHTYTEAARRSYLD